MKKCFPAPILLFISLAFNLSSQAEAPWSAQWIGVPEAVASNEWLCFRKQVTLDAVPASVPVRIACDSKYWLWVNGEPVVFEGQLKRGPTPQDTYCDEIDLAPHLRRGENTIAVLLWYWGKPGFSHNSSGQAGLLFDATLDGKPFLISDTSWKVIRHPAFGNTDKPYPNFRLSEPNIQFDARLDIGSWMSPAFDDHTWAQAVEFGKPPIVPWGKLVLRPIPQWKNSGLRDYENTPPKESDGGTVVSQLPYNAQLTPYLKIEAPAGLAIDIRTDDDIVGDQPCVRAVYITRDGVQEYESPGWMNGHQVRYTIPKGVKILALKYRETGYDADFAGRFECDDPALNRLWEKARRTLYVTMRDNYMDCPDRERAQWWGDAVNELGEAFYVFDFARGPQLARKAILELARWQRADGSLYAPVPAGVVADRTQEIGGKTVKDGTWNRELPMQILASVGWYGFWNYYLYTGDRETIAKVYPAVRSYLALWKLGPDGLAVHRAGEWDWPDWGKNADVAVLDNAWLYLALKAAVEMARLTDNTADVAGYQEKMRSIAAAFNDTFWKRDHYHSPSHPGDTDDRANAMAVVAGLAKPEQYPAIRRVLAEKTYASPYMEKYVLEALFLMGAPEQGLERMKSRYAPMLDDNISTLWENFGGGEDRASRGTYNHAWSGGPLTILSQYAAGLAPTTPGWKTFSVRPHMGTLKDIAASVSTSTGDIRVAIQRTVKQFRIELDAPPDTLATVCVPKPANGDWRRIRVNDAVVWDGKRDSSQAGPSFVDPQYHRLEVPAGHSIILAD
ncbi:MAG: glycoside hydrolase [Verrucomicrobiaceae bacterium]|nr:MAG: glycoside hydrolase [Verrucomicrobiaceae bacterium]